MLYNLIGLLLLIAPFNTYGESPGKLIFGPIGQLEENTYYLWGANLKNYRIRDPKVRLAGGGMASNKGPTCGWGHPHYIGVITVSLSFEENDRVFEELKDKLMNGANIVIPTLNGHFSLGAGIAKKRFSDKKEWYKLQRYLLRKILELSVISEETIIPEGTYWSDFSKISTLLNKD